MSSSEEEVELVTRIQTNLHLVVSRNRPFFFFSSWPMVARLQKRVSYAAIYLWLRHSGLLQPAATQIVGIFFPHNR